MLKMFIGLLAGLLIAVMVANFTSASFLDFGQAQAGFVCDDDIGDDEDDPNEIDDDLDDIGEDCDDDDDDDLDDADDDRGEPDDEDDPNEVDDD